MEEYKEKLQNAVSDGILDATDVISRLMEYLTDDEVAEIIENADWGEMIGIRKYGESEEDEEY